VHIIALKLTYWHHVLASVTCGHCGDRRTGRQTDGRTDSGDA